jgi:hypothetical protein
LVVEAVIGFRDAGKTKRPHAAHSLYAEPIWGTACKCSGFSCPFMPASGALRWNGSDFRKAALGYLEEIHLSNIQWKK